MKQQVSLLTLSIALLAALSLTHIQAAAALPPINIENNNQLSSVIPNANLKDTNPYAVIQPSINNQQLQTTQKNNIAATKKLIAAIRADNGILAQEAIDEKADVNTIDIDGKTPLSEAIFHNNSALVSILLKHNADPNKQNRSNRFPNLIWATRRNYTTIVNMLLEHKADPNVQDDHLFTPLLYTTYSHCPDIMEPLILHGADPDIKSSLGHCALDLATPSAKKILIHALQKKVLIDLHKQNWELEALIDSHIIEHFTIPELAPLICAYANPYYTTTKPLYGIMQQHIQNNIKQMQSQAVCTPSITHTSIATPTSTPLLCCAQAPQCNCMNLQEKTISCNRCVIS